MASKLCCTAEQDGRSDSPELPNARLTGITPTKQPLLPEQHGSPKSRFTSIRSDELHELHEIFNQAQDGAQDRTTPTRVPRARFSRTSIYSLHSLHKMTSMRSLIKRKFSRDLRGKSSGLKIHIEATQKVTTGDQDTIVRTSKDEAKQQLQITKEHLRKDLLSDKRPDEDGYDSDAEMLDDIAKNISKRTPSKRASIHSVKWSPSTRSKVTPGSSTKSRIDADCNRDLQPYQIQKPATVSLATRVGHVLSTPNLRVDVSKQNDRGFRRSQSATSIRLPQVSPLSPLRLPSLTSYDQHGVLWSDAINESLRLSQFPAPPRHSSSHISHVSLPLDQAITTEPNASPTSTYRNTKPSKATPNNTPGTNTRPVEICIQQPTSITSPRPSLSVRGTLRDKAQHSREDTVSEDDNEEDDHLRHSVHLDSMRISHHLRSGSLLSWEQFSDAPELPSPTRSVQEREVSGQSQFSHLNKQPIRHDRQTSSSGFTSSKVPSRWGEVLTNKYDLRGDIASSVYSSRPQSPPDDFVASLTSLGWMGTDRDNFSKTPDNSPRARGGSSNSPDSEETPRAASRYEPSNLTIVQSMAATDPLLATPGSLARKNSVAVTKKSKFREEFSPSPPRKRITPSDSIMKFLNPKRLSARSQSDASLKPRPSIMTGDAAFDTLTVPDNRERRQSQSMMSLQAEQDALGKHKGADHVWNQALKAHQEEKASLFLPKNRDLAVHASPFRERSGSIATRHSANDAMPPTKQNDLNASESFFDSSVAPRVSGDPGDTSRPGLLARRSATVGASDNDFGREISIAFEKQGDDTDIVGAWGRYPSHTRNERVFSAGKSDRVESRDFALEAAINFAASQNVDDDETDPTECIPSMPLLPGEKKRKKKRGGGHIPKSNSMTFGKTFLKNYSRIFKSQSAEFRRHGRNHRSSIAAGGVLEFPELEILPEVWKQGSSLDGSSDTGRRHQTSVAKRRAIDTQEDSKLQTHDSMATLRPRRNSSAPNLSELALLDGAGEDRCIPGNARGWSVYYNDCVPSYPRVSTEAGFGLEDFAPSRFSLESRRPSMHSRTMPTRSARHSRNTSHVSRTSVISRGSVHPSIVFASGDEDRSEKRSMVSVRRSTMDLISKFKEQEIIEREKVLSITRTASCQNNGILAAL